MICWNRCGRSSRPDADDRRKAVGTAGGCASKPAPPSGSGTTIPKNLSKRASREAGGARNAGRLWSFDPGATTMLLLAAYAALSWYAILRKRRTWAGLALLILSLAGVAVLAYLDLMLHRLLVGGPPGIGFQLILASEAAIILGVGTMLLLMPRDRAAVPCRGCGYELRGLDDANPRCPECGLENAARRPREGRCVECDAPIDSEATLPQRGCAKCQPTSRLDARTVPTRSVRAMQAVEVAERDERLTSPTAG